MARRGLQAHSPSVAPRLGVRDQDRVGVCAEERPRSVAGGVQEDLVPVAVLHVVPFALIAATRRDVDERVLPTLCVRRGNELVVRPPVEVCRRPACAQVRGRLAAQQPPFVGDRCRRVPAAERPNPLARLPPLRIRGSGAPGCRQGIATSPPDLPRSPPDLRSAPRPTPSGRRAARRRPRRDAARSRARGRAPRAPRRSGRLPRRRRPRNARSAVRPARRGRRPRPPRIRATDRTASRRSRCARPTRRAGAAIRATCAANSVSENAPTLVHAPPKNTIARQAGLALVDEARLAAIGERERVDVARAVRQRVEAVLEVDRITRRRASG